MPSGIHNKLERHAYKLLINEGFVAEKEHPVLIPLDNGETKKFIVDVVGIRKDRKIAVECQNVKYSKLQLLKTVFDEVWHITIEDYVNYLENKIKTLEKQIPKHRNRKIDKTPKKSKKVSLG